MKPSLSFACAALLALLSAQASATVWQGTITETITATNDFRNHPGQTAIGSYSYESDSIDGTFTPGTANLEATLFTFKSDAMNGGLVHLTDGFFYSSTVLTVANGEVTNFFKTGQTNYDFGFDTTTFLSMYQNYINFGEPGAPWFFQNEGTMSFSRPEAVPEGSVSTALFLTFSLSGLIATRLGRKARR